MGEREKGSGRESLTQVQKILSLPASSRSWEIITANSHLDNVEQRKHHFSLQRNSGLAVVRPDLLIKANHGAL